MIVVKDKIGLTEYLEDKKLIISTYKGIVESDLSFSHLSKVVAFYKVNEVKGAVIDLQNLYGSFVRVMEYLTESFYPIASKSGLKAQAYILKDDLIIKNMAEKLKILGKKFNIEARTFSNKEEALKWIESVI